MTTNIYESSCDLLALQQAVLQLQKDFESFRAECETQVLDDEVKNTITT